METKLIRKCEIIRKPELVENRLTIAKDRITLKILPDTRNPDAYMMMWYAKRIAAEVDRLEITNTLRGRISVESYINKGIVLQIEKGNKNRPSIRFDANGKHVEKIAENDK